MTSMTTAERIAEVLRRRITEGELRPGTQLCEERLVGPLGVSRNTLRETFRLLTHDGLLVHRLHQGVFVTELDEDDLADLYRLRRVVECGVVRSLTATDPDTLAPLRRDVEVAERAAARGEWREVGTANMHFHQHLVGLGGSRRTDELTRRLLAELRLVFHVVDSPHALHESYIARNRALFELVAAGRTAQAAQELEQYLRDSEVQLLAAYRARREAEDEPDREVEGTPAGGAAR